MQSIATGKELAAIQFTLDGALVQDYLAATEDSSSLYTKSGLVPFTAVAALGVRTVLGGLSLPPGTIHLAQELTAHKSASLGQRVSCSAKVAQSSQRREGTFLVLEFVVADAQGQALLDGKTTLMVPSLKAEGQEQR